MEIAVRDEPYHFFSRHGFSEAEGDKGLTKTNGENVVQFLGRSREIFRPPVTDMADVVKGFFCICLHGDACLVIFLVHVELEFLFKKMSGKNFSLLSRSECRD